ncbi:MAG: DsbA family protein, partial [Inquilinus limosus]|nr:DsbA family protein [Inquilinus limosus]
EIFRSASSPVIGNAQGDVTLVEFFDYQCGYCKRAQPDLERLVKQDTGLKVVLKEFPILGPASVTAARASLAAKMQGKYLEFHTKMMGLKGQLTDQVIYDTAQQVGLDLDKLKQDMNDASVVAELRANMDLAQALGVQGTPAFVINDQIIPGAVGFDALKSEIDKERAG